MALTQEILRKESGTEGDTALSLWDWLIGIF